MFCQKKPQGLTGGLVSDVSAGGREMPPNLSCQDWVGSMNLKCGQGTDFMQRLVICYNALTGTLIMKHSLAF